MEEDFIELFGIKLGLFPLTFATGPKFSSGNLSRYLNGKQYF